jgi:multimeric flavodoxin WrbA
MSKVLVLEGSPREGNTTTVVNWVIAGMGRGVEVTRMRLCEKNIHPCHECFTCAKTKKGAGCAQEDEMVEIYDKMVDADLIIWASPIFCWNVTAQTKMVLDRCFALMTGEDILKGEKWALVVTAGGDHFDGADLAVEMFKRMTAYSGIKLLGQHVVASCPDGKKLAANAALRKGAEAFGKELAKALKQ